MLYQRVILFIVLVIVGWLGYLTYSGYQGSVQEYDQDIQQRLMEELIIDLLKADQSGNTSSLYEVTLIILNLL